MSIQRYWDSLSLLRVSNSTRRRPLAQAVAASEPVALVFERGNKLLNEYGRVVAQIGESERTREKFGISSVDQRAKKDTSPLQAADLIAYATYKCLAQKVVDQWLSDSFEELFSLPTEGVVHTGAEQIAKYLRHLEDSRSVFSEHYETTAKAARTRNAR